MMDQRKVRLRGAAVLTSLLLVLMLLLLCACGVEELFVKPTEKPTVTAAPTAAPVVPTAEPVTGVVNAEFFDRGQKVGETGELAAGTILNPVSYDISNDYENEYEFLGWDADGDGVPEEFPYTLNSSVQFTAVLKITPIVYHYDIYVRGNLVASKDCKYGDMIEYPEVESTLEGDKAYFFKGWSYNGNYDGLIIQNITENYRIEAVYADSQIVTLHYNNGTYAKYVEEGAALPGMSDWNVYPESGFNIVWYTDAAMKNKFTGTTMIKGNLTLYGRQERSGDYNGYTIESKEQLKQVMDSVFLMRTTKVKMLIKYNYGSLDDLKKFIAGNCIHLYGYSLSITTRDKEDMEFTLSYSPVATTRSSKVVYQQLPSANSILKQSTRPANYDNFAVNRISKSCNVNNSEALFYVLEQGMRPVIDGSARDVINLYDTMKQILRTYVSDDMSDTEKALAIYQYLILSVTYDGELLEKVKNNQNSEGNRSFFLEGAIMDQLAVCDGLSKAFVALCRMEGIECVRVVGTKVENGLSHAWNKVKLGGNWYVADVTSDNMIVGNDELMSLKYFMITDDQNERSNKPDAGSHTDIKCTTSFDIHEALGLKASSVDAAAELLKQYINIAPEGKSSFEIKLGYGITSDSEAVDEILRKMNMTISVSFSGSNGIYCFVYTK